MSSYKILFCFAALSAITSSGQISPTVSSSTGNFTLTCTNPTIILSANSSFTAPVSYTWTNPQLTVVSGSNIIATSPGTYSLAASSGTVLETVTVSIVINTVQPTLNFSAASGSITCATPTILMTAATNPTNVAYTWIEPSVGFGCTSSTCIAAQAGTYTVMVKDLVNGCQKTATITIGDNRVYPVFSSIGLYTIACPNGTVSLEPALITTTTNISFQWTAPAGAVTSATNNLNLITNAPGQYSLIATNTTNGCMSTTLVSVYACVGIGENFPELKITGYPNPASTVFKIEIERGTDITVTLADIAGQMVSTPSKETEVDLTLLKAGVYFITVQSSKGRKIFKVVKE